MKALTPAALTPYGGSLRLLCLVFRTSNPQPRYGPECRFRSRLNALGGSCDPGFAMNEQGSPHHPAETGSSSCRLFVRLRLLSTPHRCDAVTFGYMCHDFTSDGLSPS